MPLSPLEHLRHILDETKCLMSRSHGLSKDESIRGETLKRAFVRSVEIIGEAAEKVPNDSKQKYAHIEWRAIAGMRDKLIHDYFGIDYDIVCDVVINKLPGLRQEVEQIIRSESNV